MVQIEAIRSDRVRGASELALKALEILGRAALQDESETTEELAENLRHYVSQLLQARPAMAAVTNCVRCFEKHLTEVLAHSPDIGEARRRLVQAARQIADAAVCARSLSILETAQLVSGKGTVATCSFSSTVVDALKKAKELGNVFRVICLESAIGESRYGEFTVSRLTDCGLPAAVVPDSHVEKALAEADMVLIGCDSVFRDGSVINGYPSLLLAHRAALLPNPVPLYCIADWTKVCVTPLGESPEPGFDLVPSKLVSGIITEKGLFAPSDFASFVDTVCC